MTKLPPDLIAKADNAATYVGVMLNVMRPQFVHVSYALECSDTWDRFQRCACIAGCSGMATQLGLHVPRSMHIRLVCTLRDGLERRHPHTEKLYDACSEFVIAGFMDIERSQRADAYDGLLAMWTVMETFGADTMHQHRELVHRLKQVFETKLPPYWIDPQSVAQVDDATTHHAKPRHLGHDLAAAGAGVAFFSGVLLMQAVLSVGPIVLALLIVLWLLRG